MPAFLDQKQLNAKSMTDFLNYLSANLVTYLRSGVMTEEQLDQIIALIKQDAFGPEAGTFQHHIK